MACLSASTYAAMSAFVIGPSANFGTATGAVYTFGTATTTGTCTVTVRVWTIGLLAQAVSHSDRDAASSPCAIRLIFTLHLSQPRLSRGQL